MELCDAQRKLDEAIKEPTAYITRLRQHAADKDALVSAILSDKDVALVAAGSHPREFFACAPKSIRGDKDVVLAAVARLGRALAFASVPLRADPDVIAAAVAHEGAFSPDAEADLRFVSEACDKRRIARAKYFACSSAPLSALCPRARHNAPMPGKRLLDSGRLGLYNPRSASHRKICRLKKDHFRFRQTV